MSLLNPLNDLVAWVIMRIHAVLGAAFGPASGLAWGLSIVILVMLIRLCLVPLFVKQVHAQRKMAQHAPQLQELRKKYKGDKQRLNEETMKFYKENGVNPLAGCLPMIPQMIVFFALFSVLRAIADWTPGHVPQYGLTVPVVVSARQATIFGVHLYDKLLFAHPMRRPLHVAIVIAITVVISATTTFMTVRQSAKRGLMQTNVDPDNPMAQSQKYMQYIVPFFSLTGLYWQYGLVLYWVTTNLWTLGQQYFMFRNWTTEPVGADGAVSGGTTTGGPARATQSSLAAGFGSPSVRCGQDGGQRRADRFGGQRRAHWFGERADRFGGQRRADRFGERADGGAGDRHGPAQGQHGVRLRPDGQRIRRRADRDRVPPRYRPGHRAERHGKARAAETGPGETGTRAPGRRARR